MTLFEERLKYSPPVPSLLKKSLVFSEGELTDSVADADALKKLFPHTFGRPLVRGQIGHTSNKAKIGVVLSGGQAPGGHNVIAALFDATEGDLIGFQNGPSGIVDGHYQTLTRETIDQYRNTGGFDMIGSGRTKIETVEQLASSMKVCQELALDGLVVIGGDDSNTNAAILAEYFLEHGCKTTVVGVPKTIDGDLAGEHIEVSFGFDTASRTYAEMIGNLGKDALSAKKYTHFVKLMGRSASHIALECALLTQPNLTLISEEHHTLASIIDEITTLIMKRADMGKNYGIILIPEGLIEFVPEKEELLKTLDLEKDPHGNIQVAHIQIEKILIEEVKKELKIRKFAGKFSPVAHYFGYEGRSAYPTNFDASYTYALGLTAAHLIFNERTGYIAAVKNLTQDPNEWEVWGVPLTSMMNLEERSGKKKPVIQKSLVDLQGSAYQEFASKRGNWALDDTYLSPGPIQFTQLNCPNSLIVR